MKVLLTINNIEKSYGGLTLLRGAQATISDGQKIGVVGRNGAGKSTLFQIIMGKEEADSGNIVRSSGLRLAWLEQEAHFEPGETVADFLMRKSAAELWICEKTAHEFGLSDALLQSPVADLSGGYQMRARLMALLLTDPELLLMDEPTNYLDLSTQILLEQFLRNFDGSYLIISHDREFLMRTCTHTLEVENGELMLFPGTIEQYLDFKADQQAQAIAYNKNIDARRKALESFVERFRAKASKAAQAQSKMKQLARLEKVDLARSGPTVRIPVPEVRIRKGSALSLNDLSIGYADHRVAWGIDVQIGRGSHVAILGDNGQGKSTFLKTISGVLPPLSGSIQWGEENIGFYAQHVYSSISESLTVFDHLQHTADRSVSRQQILDMAGCFLFRGDDVKKSVKMLSGGERARLCLAGLLLRKCAVLLLDEPTNHLDFETVEALGLALANFAGTLLFVSHDRTFVNLVASQIITVEDGTLELYPGSYADYVFRMESRLQENPVLEKKSARNQAKVKASGGSTKVRRRQKEVQTQLELLEKELEVLQKEQSALLASFQEQPGDDRERRERLFELDRLIPLKEEEWIQAGRELEEAGQKS
ncbi:MAG: ABC-F family ATP-binding cassette domain-containing protein [Spirochaetales bacterium]|nr:ABC-F family ATP-binding cassette domain-containing protein [Spirochaetales bacterium]